MIDTLLTRMESFGDADAIVFDGRTFSYAELAGSVADWRMLFDREGVVAGEIVALEGSHSPAACAALLALVKRGAIVVPMTALPAAKRAEFLDIAQVEITVTVGADAARSSCSRTGVHAVHPLYDELRGAAAPGLVLFSSGTTGRSKASVLNFEKVLARYGEPRRPQRTMSFLNLDHIGGINTLMHTLSQGGALVTIAERTPEQVFQAVQAHRVEVLPTTPTFLTMTLISGAHQRYDTSSLGLITYGTEPMPEQTLTRLREDLPDVRLKQTYGLSELGILPTKSKSDDSLWVKLGGASFDYKIVDGVLWIKSEMAMLGYLNAPAPFDDEGYFNTQDAVQTSGDYIRILGRTSELINVAGEKVYPNEVESVLLEMPNIAEATVSGRPSPVTGMVVKAVVRLVEDEDDQTLRRRVRRFCTARLEPYKVPAFIEISHDALHSDRFKKVRSA